MSEEQRIARFFDHNAQSFDGIYSGRKNIALRLLDRYGRKNIQQRFHFTIDALSPVKGKRILDVGCGSGRYGIELARLGAAEVVGLDLSERMLQIAERLSLAEGFETRFQFVHSDVLAFSPDEPFDGVIANGFFDYVRDPLPVLRHLRGMTRGLLIATFPARWAFRVALRRAWLNARGCPVFFYNASGIKQLCEEAELSNTRVLRRGPIYLLVAEPGSSPNT